MIPAAVQTVLALQQSAVAVAVALPPRARVPASASQAAWLQRRCSANSVSVQMLRRRQFPVTIKRCCAHANPTSNPNLELPEHCSSFAPDMMSATS